MDRERGARWQLERRLGWWTGKQSVFFHPRAKAVEDAIAELARRKRDREECSGRPDICSCSHRRWRVALPPSSDRAEKANP